jgi:GH25 family lysozyme M1 (1,4-beta-N-acetylmuramidase)
MFPIMDVSRWQGNIDWDKVKASGLVSGVMLRALGNSAKDAPSKPYIDPTFERNYRECQRLGIPCGVYYYCKAVNTAEADAELALLRPAKRCSCRWRLTLRIPMCKHRSTSRP